MLVLISLLSIFIPFEMKYSFIIPTIATLIISLLQILNDFNLFKLLNVLYMHLPLADIQLAWLVPFIILLIIGLIIDYVTNKSNTATT